MYYILILDVVLYGFETWTPKLRTGIDLTEFENRKGDN
jgi:hypothetical protein